MTMKTQVLNIDAEVGKLKQIVDEFNRSVDYEDRLILLTMYNTRLKGMQVNISQLRGGYG